MKTMKQAATLVVLVAFTGCVAETGAPDAAEEQTTEPGPDDGKTDAVGGSNTAKGAVVDCAVASDLRAVRTCALHSSDASKDACTVIGTVNTGQIVRNTAAVKPILGKSAMHQNKSVYVLDAAEAKLLANLKYLGLLRGSSGAVSGQAYYYDADGAPFVYSTAPTGMSVVTKTSANETIARVKAALEKAASTCQRFRVASTDGLTSAAVSFICENDASSKFLYCDGTAPAGIDYAFGPSVIVDGVELNFAKTGCGAFRYDLVNRGSTSASFESQITGISLSPPCSGNLGANGGTGFCTANGIAGPSTLTFSGSISRSGVKTPFSVNVGVRCNSL